jgi:hypothetical protein
LPRRLCGVGATPERAGIDAVWIEGEHPVVKFSGTRRLFVQTIEILDIAARFIDVPRRIVGIERPSYDVILDNLLRNRREISRRIFTVRLLGWPFPAPMYVPPRSSISGFKDL